MSDHLKFDPYTGDPIPEEPEVNTQQNPIPQDSYIPQETVSQNEYPQQEGMTQNTIPQQEDTTQNTIPQQDSYVPQSTMSNQSGTYVNSAPQYNPYTGQNLNAQNDANKANARASKLGTASLIVGICSIVFSFCTMCCCPILSLGLGIAGIICGVKAKDANGDRLGTGTAGLITSIIGLVITVFFLILMLIYMATPQFQEDFKKGFEQGMKQYQTQNKDNPFGNDDNSEGGYKNYDNDVYDSDGFFSN